MNKLIACLMLAAMLSSCSDLLEEKPKSLASENFYNTAAEAKAAVNAIYGPMRSDGGVGINYPAQLEGLADYGNSRGTQTPVSLYQGLDNTNINRVGSIWTSFYQSIRNANLVISNVPKGTAMTDAEKASFVAEAKYLRALTYFAMVRNWAGVPLRTEENMTIADVPRASVADVYALILADALEAEQNLPDNPGEIGRPTKWAAKTLLSEVYLYQEDWASAAARAREVIDSKKYALVEVAVAEDFQKIYGPEVVTTSEEIFYFKFSRQQGFGLVSYAHRKIGPYNYYGPGGVYAQYTDSVTNSVIRNWDFKDLRKPHILYNVDIGLGATSMLFRKYRDPLATAGAGNDYPWYRYADLLLFHAEADARAAKGVTAGALESLNKVHRRAYGLNSNAVSATDFKLTDFPTLASFIDKVVQERGYETMYEGKRWNDLKRLGIAKQRILEVKNIVIAEKHMLWPIPNSELLYNKAISASEQNPGY
ncbi:RagB/SusD family nutrient uptake outer membrane protein [Dyadobacter sandarakinus]|uniref:RagB/SusD family nutrient uptake outer membrane protein n=1 Tax=Dyadobacter sandarakinus TaxID=2747268 RepID=A0ABX7IC10_9BACT|nr:RagB/SusD family nutrient uptake outer membrane protein [Dyadobacter sandarakinus]QRR03253.1 RagB/SusD family nutrient uptake outer membrane protein [Dyadobacter sandarakinus]